MPRYPHRRSAIASSFHASTSHGYVTNYGGDGYEDARNGDLPAYGFIEPRMVFNHNDMHPPWGEKVRESESEIDVDGEKVPLPAIVISEYTAAGTVIHDEMHHGSVINTLCRQHASHL